MLFTLDWSFALWPEVCSKEGVFSLSLPEEARTARSLQHGAFPEAPGSVLSLRGGLRAREAIFKPDLECPLAPGLLCHSLLQVPSEVSKVQERPAPTAKDTPC